MSTTVNVLCYKSKVLSNGESPLMLRICKDGKKKYKSLGISIKPIYWDYTKNKLKRNCPNYSNIHLLITEQLNEYSNQIVDLETSKKEFTASSLMEKLEQPIKKDTVKDFIEREVYRLKAENRINYASSHKHLLNSLLSFKKNLEIPFCEIDVTWLKNYESFLKQQGLANNSIGIRFRTLRAVYNRAIEENLVKAECYPFKKYKVSKLHEETLKRAISKKDIKRIMEYSSSNPSMKFSIDLFLFSYFMGGINFVDMAYLTKDNIIDNRLIYSRRKTSKLIKLPLQPKAIELIHKYADPDNPYLFPILSTFHKTEQQQRNRIHKVISKVNDRLKAIGKELGLPIDLTTYVARHSFATSLKRSGVSTSLICEALGHSSERVTQIYLDSFGNDQMEDAMKNLL